MRQRTRYSAVAMLLHWSIAALIIANLFLGWRMGFLKGLAQFDMFQLHKSVGITVLVLSIVRLVWRMLNPVPPLPAGKKGWEVAAAHVTHWAFYGLMIGLPLTGWAVVSVSPWNIPTLLWHTIPWPHIGLLHDLPINAKQAVEKVGGSIHMYFAFGGTALIVMHIGAALKHQFISRDGVLGRMVPGLRSTPHTSSEA